MGNLVSTCSITSPSPMLTSTYQANVPVGQFSVQNGSAAIFHPNMVQTSTSPPNALPPMYSSNPLATNQGVAGAPFQFGQIEPQMNPFAAANPHQNPIHSVIPHFMPVQPSATAQQNVPAFNQHMMNPAAALTMPQPSQATMYMAQIAHVQQSLQQVDHMNKFSLNQPNNLLANNILKSQQFVNSQPSQAASAGGHLQTAALHAQQQGTANWAAAAAQGQQPSHPYANPITHFVQAVPGQPAQQQSQSFNRQQNAAIGRNSIDQTQAQSQNALRSFFHLNDAMQNQQHTPFIHHNTHHGHHNTARQQHAAALQQTSQQTGQAAFQQNAMNHSWPNPLAQQQMLLKTMQNRQLMQFFAASSSGQPISAIGPTVGTMGMSGGSVTNHRTSPSGPAPYPSPIQRPNNGSVNQSNKNSNRNGTGIGNKSFSGSGSGLTKGVNNRNNYYNHNNRNSTTPSPSECKSTSISSDLNGTSGGPISGTSAVITTANSTIGIAVDCSANVLVKSENTEPSCP